MTKPSTPREQALLDLFTTGLEGGIGYWSAASEYRYSDTDGNETMDFRAVIHEMDEDEDGYSDEALVVDKHTIRRGMQRLYRHMIDLGDEASRYQMQACRDFTFGRWDDFDFDSDTADLVIQMGLFGKIVYA
jgi:hypothetical protein